MIVGQNVTQAEMEAIYRDADEDDNGFITFDEFNTKWNSINNIKINN